MKGKLVTVEGIDGAGKSSLFNSNKGSKNSFKQEYPNALLTCEPQEKQWIGKQVRKAINDESISDMSMFFLFMASHSQHIQDYINPALENNKLVISDRYIDSRYAYQQNVLEDIINTDSLTFIQQIQEAGWSTLPDLTLLLDIPVETAIERLEENENDRFEKINFLRSVRNCYLKLAENNDRFVIIDATQSQDKVFEDCVHQINKII